MKCQMGRRRNKSLKTENTNLKNKIEKGNSDSIENPIQEINALKEKKRKGQ